MTTVRVYRAESAEPATPPKVRIYRAESAGAVAAAGKVRVYRAESAGTAGVVVAPMASQTVEPEALMTVTASLVGGGAADSWLWRRVSGPALSTFSSAGAVATLRTPSAMPPGTTVVLGARAVVGSVTSAEVTVTLDVLPQTEWSRVPGANWVGATR